jgi:hypothetical protein
MIATLEKSTPQHLADLVKQGTIAFADAGKLAVELIDSREYTLASLAEAAELPIFVISKLERIGRGQLLPELLLAGFPASRYLSSLPFSEQKRLAKGRVPLLVKAQEGWDTLEVEVKNLSEKQCRQIFNQREVRSTGAQRAYLEEHAKTVAPSIKAPWRARGKTIIVERPCELTAQDILNMLQQISGK